MACREKWIIKWRDPKTKKRRKISLYNENEALSFLITKTQQGIDTEHVFYPCRSKK